MNGIADGEVFVWAHRGASARAPENTMGAFAAAEADGADGIELDVHLSRDGIPVVIHDDSLERTTDGRGAVARFSLAELKRLDAGSWFGPSFGGEPIPTLEEVLQWAGGRMRLNVEIKSAAAGEAVRRLLQKHPGTRVLVSSFDHELLEKLRRAAPDLPIAFLLESRFWRRTLERALACGAESLHLRHDRASRALLDQAARYGLKTCAWTVDDPERARTLLRRGIRSLMTNDPFFLRGCLGCLK